MHIYYLRTVWRFHQRPHNGFRNIHVQSRPDTSEVFSASSKSAASKYKVWSYAYKEERYGAGDTRYFLNEGIILYRPSHTSSPCATDTKEAAERRPHNLRDDLNMDGKFLGENS